MLASLLIVCALRLPPAAQTTGTSAAPATGAHTRRALLASGLALAAGASPASASQLADRVMEIDKAAEKRNSLGCALLRSSSRIRGRGVKGGAFASIGHLRNIFQASQAPAQRSQ